MRRSCKNAKRDQVWLRLISTGLTLLMLVLLAPDGVFAQVLCSFTGTWNTTSFGEMKLTQNGSAVSGTYTHHQGRIEGAVFDGVLVGTWTEAPSRAAPRDAGDIEFRLSDDCTEFSGSWRYGSTGPMNSGWNGTRKSVAPPPLVSNILGQFHGYYWYAKQHICDFAVNLGQAAARELLFGKAYQGEPPAGQLAAITAHMTNAAAHLAAAEELLEPPFSNERPLSVLAQVTSKLDGYMVWRVGKNPKHRHDELKNIWKQYQGTFASTFVSSRPDAFEYNPTCDSQIHKVCFQFGRASIAAAISPADRQAIGADGVQSESNSGMRSAIFGGLELAMDGRSVRPVGGVETSTNRVCCAFGSPASWEAFKFQTRSPLSAYTTAKGTLDEILKGAVLRPGQCGEGGFNGNRPVVPGGDCRCPSGTTEVPGLLGQSHCEDDVTHETVPHICDDVIDDDPGLIYSEAQQIRISNPARAFRLMQDAAQAGNVKAQRELGHMYYNGEGTSEDQQQASEWWLRAAEQGDRTAQFNISTNYHFGRGVAKDYAAAARWYRKAGDQGHAMAQNNLAALYAEGRGVEKDAAEAVYWYRKAAEQGLAIAQNNLGFKYWNGEGVERDDSQAVYWYRKAAGQTYAKAQRSLGYAYQTGRGVARDYAEALRWYRLAADQGNPDAQNDLGTMYNQGWGVERDYASARRWFERAAEQDLGPAFYNLGQLYAYGLGVNKDEDRAVDLYREAARRGRKPAQEELRKRGLSW